MVLSRNKSFKHIEREMGETFEKVYNTSKNRLNVIWINVQGLGDYITCNFSYFIKHMNHNKNRDIDRINKENEYRYHVRHNILINELKQKHLDQEWEAINNV